MNNIKIFIENLTTTNWLFIFLPYLFRKTLENNSSVFIYFFDCPKFIFIMNKMIAKLLNFKIEKLSYKIENIRDEKGFSVRLKVAYQEMAEVQTQIKNRPEYNLLIRDLVPNKYQLEFVNKSLCEVDHVGLRGYKYIWNSLLLINVFMWHSNQMSTNKNQKTIIFLERRIWSDVIKDYGAKQNAEIVMLTQRKQIKLFLKITDHSYLRQKIKKVFHRLYSQFSQKTQIVCRAPSIASEYYGHLNIENPQYYSDLFFLQQSKLNHSDIRLLFRMRGAPLEKKMYIELKKHNVEPVVLDMFASKAPLVVLHKFNIKNIQESYDSHRVPTKNLESKWLRSKLSDYKQNFSYWSDVFEQHNVKLFIQWNKYEAEHIVIADAIQRLGGISAVYQRSFEACPTPGATLISDIEFSFSVNHVELERQNNSKILYHIATGYPGDHRFPLLQNESYLIRQLLHQNGARHIISYFDENTADDPRWFCGHDFIRTNLIFLLEKVLAHPWLGLVIKPKRPGNLRQRLGEVQKMLDDAIATNRCYIFSGGVLHGSHPPALAALASDVSIHDSLSSATAGFESALCGVPTLLMDFEGWPNNKLYSLGVGNVVFTDWSNAWDACRAYFNNKENISCFGDWSSMLKDLDSFRDGRAAERIGTYLNWLLDGFKCGLTRNTAMADAAERYCKQWGYDKIKTIS